MSGTLTAEQVRYALHRHNKLRMVRDVDGFDVPQVTFDWQAIADELNARAERTCKNIHEPPRNGTFWPTPHFKCSECKNVHVSMDYVYYCPNCAAKVVDE